MNFYIKRLFINSNYKSNNFVDKTIYIKSPNDYVKNKFLNALSTKFYNKETNYLYFYNDFRTNHINNILMNELNLCISSSNTKNINHIIDLNDVIKNYSEENIKYNKTIIDLTKKDFFSSLDKINEIFETIHRKYNNNLHYENFNKFKDDFINSIFKNSKQKDEFKTHEYFISSVGIEGFKTFSNYIPNEENKVFIINDDFNSFKCLLINEVINKAKQLNLSYEIYKNPLNTNVIDHIKIPSLNLCIISNTFLFKEKLPGIQINEEMFFKNELRDEEFLYQKKLLKDLIENINPLCKTLQENYLILDDFFENCIIKNKFNNLIDNTIKNVIR